MTPERSRHLSNRWFTLAVLAIVSRSALAAAGFDLLDLPLILVATGCCIACGHRSGWASGYWARHWACRGCLRAVDKCACR